jgi:hypothetical protein
VNRKYCYSQQSQIQIGLLKDLVCHIGNKSRPTKVQIDLADKTSIYLTKSVYCKSNTATSNKTYLPEILANFVKRKSQLDHIIVFPETGRHDGSSVSDEMARKFRSENFWDFTKSVEFLWNNQVTEYML